MNTPEQAKELWCPMARTIRVGSARYPDAYNRVITTREELIGLHLEAEGDRDPDAEPFRAQVLTSNIDTIPDSARCIANKCAMWRWAPATKNWERIGFCGLAGRPEVAA